tara:strand:+ start:1693 stop:2487 length:795 start_codon:yes stop_codon:yes gene_type:complete
MPNISDMVSKVNRYGFIQANNYKVIFSGIVGATDTIIGNSGIRADGREIWNNRMSLSCDSVTVPGRSLSTNDFKTIGVSRELPYERLFSGDISMTFLFGRDMYERLVFETWMDNIINPINNRFNYYDNFKATADIILYDGTESPVYKARIEELYPKEIGAVELSNESSETAKQTINFAFRSYHPINIEVDGGDMSSVPYGMNDSSVFEAINSDSPFKNIIGDRVQAWAENGISTLEKYADSGRVVDRKITRQIFGGDYDRPFMP